MAGQDVAEIARRLLHVPLFEGLSLDTLAQIVSVSYPKEANAGEFFFNEGDQADIFLVLMTGRVKLTQLTPDGQQIVLRLIGPGDAVYRQPASQRMGRARHRQERSATNRPHQAARARGDCRRHARLIVTSAVCSSATTDPDSRSMLREATMTESLTASTTVADVLL